MGSAMGRVGVLKVKSEDIYLHSLHYPVRGMTQGKGRLWEAAGGAAAGMLLRLIRLLWDEIHSTQEANYPPKGFRESYAT